MIFGNNSKDNKFICFLKPRKIDLKTVDQKWGLQQNINDYREGKFETMIYWSKPSLTAPSIPIISRLFLRP